MNSNNGFYDLANRKPKFGRRPTITDGRNRINTGDSVPRDDSTGISTATVKL